MTAGLSGAREGTAADARVRERPRTSQRLRTTTVAFGLVFLLMVLAWAIPPSYNWDMLAYAAIALNEDDDTVRHQRLWRYVERDVPHESVALLRAQNAQDFVGPRATDTVHYRQTTAADPVAFAEQLPFYAVKPMYPLAIGGLAKVFDGAAIALGSEQDIGPITVSVALAKASWMALGISLFLLLRLRLSNSWAALATVGGMALPVAHSLGGYSSPDALSGVFILMGMVLALRDPSRRWTIAAAVIVLFSVTARPDNLILLGVLLTWFLWNSRIRFRWAVAAGMAGVIWHLSWSNAVGNYGWAVLVQHSFFDFAEYPSRLNPVLTPSLLLDLYISKLASSVLFFQLLVLGFCVAGVRFVRRGRNDQLLQALLVMLSYMAAHWLIFPDQKDRLMVGPYLFILSSLLFVVADALANVIATHRLRSGIFFGRRA